MPTKEQIIDTLSTIGLNVNANEADFHDNNFDAPISLSDNGSVQASITFLPGDNLENMTILINSEFGDDSLTTSRIVVEDGVPTTLESYNRDESGNLHGVTEVSITEVDSSDFTQSDFLITSETVYGEEEGDPDITRTDYTYNDDGQLIETKITETEEDGNSRVTSDTEHIYDLDGNHTMDITSYDNGNVETTSFERDSEGRLETIISEERTGSESDNSVVRYEETRFDEITGEPQERIIDIKDPDTGESVSYERIGFTCDENGEIESTHSIKDTFNEDGTSIRVISDSSEDTETVIKYDVDGNEIETQVIDRETGEEVEPNNNEEVSIDTDGILQNVEVLIPDESDDSVDNSKDEADIKSIDSNTSTENIQDVDVPDQDDTDNSDKDDFDNDGYRDRID